MSVGFPLQWKGTPANHLRLAGVPMSLCHAICMLGSGGGRGLGRFPLGLALDASLLGDRLGALARLHERPSLVLGRLTDVGRLENDERSHRLLSWSCIGA